MNRKILTLILTGVISFLLVTGCSSQNGNTDAPNADATQEEAGADQEEAKEEIAAILPADAVIGIVYTEGEGDFTDSFLTKTIGYLVAAGIPEEILVAREQDCIRIPMLEDIRSLNLSNAVAIVLYEALRQNGFEGFKNEGQLHRLTWEEK